MRKYITPIMAAFGMGRKAVQEQESLVTHVGEGDIDFLDSSSSSSSSSSFSSSPPSAAAEEEQGANAQTGIVFWDAVPAEVRDFMERAKQPDATGFDGCVYFVNENRIYKESCVEGVDGLLREMLAYSMLNYVSRRFAAFASVRKHIPFVEAFWIPPCVKKVHPALCAHIENPASLFELLNPGLTEEHDGWSQEAILNKTSNALRPNWTDADEHAITQQINALNYLIGNTQDVDPDVYGVEERMASHDFEDMPGIYMQRYHRVMNELLPTFLHSFDSPGKVVNKLSVAFTEVLAALRLVRAAHMDIKPENIFLELDDEQYPKGTPLAMRTARFLIADFSRCIFVQNVLDVRTVWARTSETTLKPPEMEKMRGNLYYYSTALYLDSTPSCTDDVESALIACMRLAMPVLPWEPLPFVDEHGVTRNRLPLSGRTYSWPLFYNDTVLFRINPEKMKQMATDAGFPPAVQHVFSVKLCDRRAALDAFQMASLRVSVNEPPRGWIIPDMFDQMIARRSEQQQQHHHQDPLPGKEAKLVPVRAISKSTLTPSKAHAGARMRRSVMGEAVPERKNKRPRGKYQNIVLDGGQVISALRKFTTYKHWDSVTNPHVSYLPPAGQKKRPRRPVNYHG